VVGQLGSTEIDMQRWWGKLWTY